MAITKASLLILLIVSLQGSSQLLSAIKKAMGTSVQDCIHDVVQRDLRDSVAYLARTMSTSNLHIIFQHHPDTCLIHALWSKTIPVKVENESVIWGTLNSSKYQYSHQFILYGELSWLSTVTAKKTRWLWIETGKPIAEILKTSTGLTNISFQGYTPDTSKSLPFMKSMKTLSDILKEGVRGILVSAGGRSVTQLSEKGKNSPTQNGITSWVNIGSIDAPGDGSWTLRHSATWSNGMIRIFHPLWPSVSFDLQGRIIRISCLKKPTVFYWDKPEARLKDTYGYAADLAKEIQRRLNFTDTLVVNTGFGAFSNGTWSGMVGDLHRGLGDASPTDFTPIWQRTQVIDFGLIYSTDPVVIISKAPSIYIRPLLVLEIFTPLVWCGMALIAILSGIMLGILTILRSSLGNNDGSLKDLSSFTAACLKILVYQASPNKFWPSFVGSRIIAGSMMFMALVCASLYSGSITAYLAIPSRSQAINSLEDVLDRKVIPAIRLLSSPYSFFLTENSGPIGEKVRKVMVTFSGAEVAAWNFLKRVADGTYSWIDTASSAIGSAGQFEKMGKQCLYHVARNPVRMDLDAFAYPKNSIVMYQFDEIMRWFRNYGIIENMKKQYYSQGCIAVAATDGPQIISIKQMQGAFYVMGVGLIVATTALFLEFILHICVRKK